MQDSTPILIGAGQFTEKNSPAVDAHPPMGIAAQAAKVALQDTGIAETLIPEIDTIAVVRIFSDSTNRPRMSNPFGRAENPPRAVARRLGADPVNAIYSHMGGNTPQKLINEMAQRIVAGDVSVVLLTGAEAIKTAQNALRANIDLNWQEEDEGSLEDRGNGEPLFTPHEFAHGIGVPTQTYPLFENAIRGIQGSSVEEHMLTMGKLFAAFTKVSAANPFSFYGTQRSAMELATVTEENRYISFPYPKLMNARDAVNQGAAVILTSVGKARKLGIVPSKWVFLHGCAEANDKINVSERVNYHSSPAMKVNADKAFAMAGKSITDMDFIDIYSCFPAAVEVACSALKLGYDDSRGLTLTGGLPFFGGPGNNYSMHAIATLVPLLRRKPGSYGLITANGGYLSKHAMGIYSAEPFMGGWARECPRAYQGAIDAMASPGFTESPVGEASIETYTVRFNRQGPEQGIIIGRLQDSGLRFLANTASDDLTLKNLLCQEGLGRVGTVSGRDGINRFTLA